MDVISKKLLGAGTGFVVRQFLPSRIERDVLAHVFELICGQGHEAGLAQTTDGNAASSHCSEAGEQTFDGVTAGRRAA